MSITIYNRNGDPRVELLSPGSSSTHVKEIQGDNVLSLSFAYWEYIPLDVGDYLDFCGERLYLKERYRPRQISDMEWRYDLKFYGVESLIKSYLVINSVDGTDNPEFTLTAPPREHVALIVACINKATGTTDWKVGRVEGAENIVIDYIGKYCNEALREIAEKVGTEWWVEGQTVNICKCEHGEPLTLGYDKGLISIDPGSADNVKFYTRLYPVGSTRNIDPEKYGHSSLQLPGGKTYVEINADRYGREDHYEKAAFVDIYPRYIGTVSGVRSETKTDKDGKQFTVYYISDSNLPFNPDQYMLPGKEIRISFQEGAELGGLGNEDGGTYYFDAKYNSAKREFELITIWPYGDDAQLPGGVFVPKVGDKYIPWNMRMPDEYYALAEAELLEAVNKFNEEHWRDISVYKASTDYEWIEDNKVELSIGRRVRLVSDKYFPEAGYRDSRITRITRKVELPSMMDIEISDVLSRTTQSKIQDSIGEVRDYARSISSSMALPDIIREGDRTTPTDNNLFSARRSMSEFISKKRADRSPYMISSDQGFEAGHYAPGESGGFFGIDAEGRAYGELERLLVRGHAIFQTLTVINAEWLGGKQYMTPGGGIKCTHVEVVKNAAGAVIAYRCYFLSRQDGKKFETMMVPGDQAIAEEFAPKAGTSEKVRTRYYWRLVTAVNNDAGGDDSANGNRYGYIELSNTDCAPDSDIPQADDDICQLGNRNDPMRQNAIVQSTVDADSPCLKMYYGIDNYSLEGRRIIGFGRDADTGEVYFRLGADDAKHYFDYKQGQGLKLRGDFSALSTIDGEGWFDRLHEEAPMQVSFDPPVLLFDGDDSSAIAKTVYAYPVVRKGNEEYEMVPGKPGFDKHTLGFDIPNDLQAGTAVTGLRVYGHGKKTEPTEFRPNLEIQVYKSLTQRSGTINLNVWIDGKAYPASLPWSLQLRGQAGVSAMSLLVTNEMAGVGCTAAGVPTGPLPTTQVSVWQGAKQLTTGVSFAVSGTNCQATVSSVVNGVATVTPSAMSSNADTAEVEITATVGGVTLTGRMSLYKVRPGANGADGQAAVIYSLEPSAQNITRTFDGEMSATKITFTQYRTTGATQRVQASDHYIRVQRVGEDAGFGGGLKAASVEKAVTAKTMSIVAELYTAAGVVLDRVRVPIMADASTMEVGGANLLPWTNKGTRGWLTGVYHPTIPRDQWDARLGKMSLLPEPDGPGVRVELQVGSDNLGALTVAKSTTYQVQFTVPAGVIQPGVRYMLSFKGSGGTQSADIDVYVNRRGTDSRNVKYIGRIKAPDKAVNGTDAAGNCLDMVYHLPFITDNLTNYDPDAQMGITFYIKLAQDNYRWWYFEFSDMMLERGNVATSYKPHLNDTDYLTEAIRGASQMIGGLMLASLLMLGSWDMTDPDNPVMKQVRAGINGLSSDSDYGQGMAIWAGGEMIDRGNPDIALALAAAAASGDTGALVRAAMAAIRHDGTAYFCRNTVRLLQNRAEIGDNIVLDDEGIKLIKDGQIKLLITDTSVANFGQPGGSTVIPLALPALTFARYLNSTTGRVQVRGASGWSRIDLNGGNPLTDGSTLSVDITIDVELGTGGGTYLEDFGLLIWLRDAATGNSITGGPGVFAIERISNTAVRLKSKFTKTFSAGSYYLQVAYAGDGGPVNGNITPTVSSTGGVTLGVRDRHILAIDGWLTTWGNTLVLARAGRVLARVGVEKPAEIDLFEGYATLRAGKYALRVSADNGFQFTTNYNEDSWKPMLL